MKTHFLRFGFFLILIGTLFQGCVRLTGNAGWWHQGTNDESPKAKQIGFDTNDYVPGAKAPGNITTEDP